MRELRQYSGPALKIICLMLAVFVMWQLAGIFTRWNPFRGVTVPALPSLTVGTNSPDGGARATNLAATVTVKATNSAQHSDGTNAALSVTMTNSNSFSPPMPMVNGTNLIARPETEVTGSNVVAQSATKLSGTNSAPATNAPDRGTNVLMVAGATGTNAVSGSKPEVKIPNAASLSAMAGMNLNQPPGKRGADLPPAVQTRISRIIDSEMLGPVVHPLPMALLGIAGDSAFLRSAGGQTGLVKEGDSLGDLKLLKIGINRVLVEQDGQKKELMIFSGYGGESLLPKQTGTPDENKNQ
jgi:hypothetical protein